VYALRYDDPAQYMKEGDLDSRFWLRLNVGWYESVILSKTNVTVDMKSIHWNYLRPLGVPAKSGLWIFDMLRALVLPWKCNATRIRRW
jgi:hypothetical protein